MSRTTYIYLELRKMFFGLITPAQALKQARESAAMIEKLKRATV